MPVKTRIIMVSVLFLFGGALFTWCAFCYPKDILANTQYCPAALTASNTSASAAANTEPNKSSQNQQSNSSGRSRPRIGAT